MVCCVVCSKRPDKKSKRSFHVFPFKKRPDNADKWVEWVRSLKNPTWTPSKRSIICSDHFTTSDFNNSTFRVELNGDSVPTIISPSDRPIGSLQKDCENNSISMPEFVTTGYTSEPTACSALEKNLPSESNDKCDVTAKSCGSSPLEGCSAGRRRSLFLHDHNYENTPTACRRQVFKLRENLQKARAINKAQERKIKRLIKRVESLKALKQLKKPEIKISTDTDTPEKTKVVVPVARGIVYIGHIPHGFFETQMHDYFKQFGKVTRVRLVRSKQTGISRGYGYVEFQHCEVAKIAAESMNNYLMSGRLLKATYIPPEKQHTGYFSGRQWSKQHYPRMVRRAQQNSQKNKNVDNKGEAALVRRGLDKLSNIQKKLEAAGVVYKIQPVEVPIPEVKKRKAPADLLSGEAKKIKVAGEPKTGKTKKPVAVAEPANKKIKTKVVPEVPKEVAVKQNKKKIESKVAAVEKKKEEPKSDASVVQNTKKKPKAQPTVANTAQPVVKTIEKHLPKKSKKVLSGVKISDDLMEEVSKAVVAAKKSKKAAAVVTPVEKPKQKKAAGVVAVAEKPQNKKKTAAASPVIEKSMQKKNVVAVPSVKKAKQKKAPVVSQNKKGKNAEKSIAA